MCRRTRKNAATAAQITNTVPTTSRMYSTLMDTSGKDTRSASH